MKLTDIIVRDLKILLTDKQAIAILIFMPIILSVILSAGLGSLMSGDEGIEQINIGLVKEYKSTDLKKALGDMITDEEIAELESSFDLEKILLVDFLGSEDLEDILSYEIMSKEKGLSKLESGEITSLVILPEDFITGSYISMFTPMRLKIDIEIISNYDSNIKASVVNSIFTSFTDALVNDSVIFKSVLLNESGRYHITDKVYEELGNLFEDYSSARNKEISLIATKLEKNRVVDIKTYFSIAMLSMFLLFTGGQAGRMMLEEKEQYTYQRMIATGIKLRFIITGKFVTVYIVGLIQSFLMITFSRFVLGVAWGNLMNTLLIACAAVFAVTSMGIMVSVVTLKLGNYKLANALENFIFQIMAFLGGSFIPLETMPRFIQKLSYLTINGLSLRAFLNNSQGFTLNEFMTLIITLIIVGMTFMVMTTLIIIKEKGWINVKHIKTENANA